MCFLKYGQSLRSTNSFWPFFLKCIKNIYSIQYFATTLLPSYWQTYLWVWLNVGLRGFQLVGKNHFLQQIPIYCLSQKCPFSKFINMETFLKFLFVYLQKCTTYSLNIILKNPLNVEDFILISKLPISSFYHLHLEVSSHSKTMWTFLTHPPPMYLVIWQSPSRCHFQMVYEWSLTLKNKFVKKMQFHKIREPLLSTIPW